MNSQIGDSKYRMSFQQLRKINWSDFPTHNIYTSLNMVGSSVNIKMQHARLHPFGKAVSVSGNNEKRIQL